MGSKSVFTHAYTKYREAGHSTLYKLVTDKLQDWKTEESWLDFR
jgi:hypothetical protein